MYYVRKWDRKCSSYGCLSSKKYKTTALGNFRRKRRDWSWYITQRMSKHHPTFFYSYMCTCEHACMCKYMHMFAYVWGCVCVIWFCHSVWEAVSFLLKITSHRFCCSVSQSCLILYDPMDCSKPGFPVLHHLLEFAHTHAHWVDDTIQPISPSVTPFSSCPQSFPASGSFLMSQLFASGGQSIGASDLASVFLMKIQGYFPLGSTGLISLQSKGLLRVFSNTTVQKHQFFDTQPSLWASSHIPIWLLKNHSFNYMDLGVYLRRCFLMC